MADAPDAAPKYLDWNKLTSNEQALLGVYGGYYGMGGQDLYNSAKTNLAYYQNVPGPGSALGSLMDQSAQRGQVQAMIDASIKAAGTGGGGTAAGGGGGGGTYYGGGGGVLATYGGSPYMMTDNGQPISPSQTNQLMQWANEYEQGDTTHAAQMMQLSRQLGISNIGAAVANLRNQTGPNAPPPASGTQGQPQPETVGLGQMAQIDPATEALRQQLAGSFATPLAQGMTAPSAAQLQSYLDLYKQIDPQTYAAIQGLGGRYTDLMAQQAATTGQVGANLPQYQDQINRAIANLAPYQSDVDRMNALAQLGTQLDPETLREVTQSVRGAQAARGNVYGTPQLVQEAMTRGQAGMQMQAQREQMLQAALGAQQGGMGVVQGALGGQLNAYQQYLAAQAAQQGGLGAYQGYLGSGLTPGAIALGLYQQQQANLQRAQQGALSYLGSGQTPYQAGAGYLNTAEQRAAAAAQGGASYNPQGPSAYYTGAGASSFPQYGLDMSQLAGNWYNNMNQASLQSYQLQQAYKKQGGSYGGIGSGIGTGLGAAVGSIIPGVGTAIGGAIGGALGGAAGSAFSG